MNERLKTFYDQVGLDFENFQRVTVTKGDIEKFAELIVLECAEVILAKASEYPKTDEWYDWTSGMDQAQAEICVHFGVEE
jgi:hypothetical protein